MATISDVARLAGLSVATVSRVINNKPHVSEKKLKLVKEAMAKLGYEPQPAARQLRGSSAQTIAVTVPRIVNPFFAYLVDAIDRTLDAAGFNILVVQTFGRAAQELAALNMLKTHQVDGVILCSIENPWQVIADYLAYGQIVLVNEYLPNVDVPVIRADQYQGLFDATTFLITKGYQHIAYVTGRKQVVYAQRGENLDADRYAGFQDALSGHGAVFHPEWLFTNAHTAADGGEILTQILAMTDPPQAIISGSDEVAMGLLQAGKQAGVNIPGQLAVLGIDDQPTSAAFSPALTTIHQPVSQMGEQAAQAMLVQLQDTGDHPVTVLPLTLVKRASV